MARRLIGMAVLAWLILGVSLSLAEEGGSDVGGESSVSDDHAPAVGADALAEVRLDRLHLVDGRVLEGRAGRTRDDGSIQFEIVGRAGTLSQWFERNEFMRIERAPRPPGTTKIAFIRLDGRIGLQITDAVLAEAIEMLDRAAPPDRPDVVVFRLASTGASPDETGALLERLKTDVIPKYRTVVWASRLNGDGAILAWASPELFTLPGVDIRPGHPWIRNEQEERLALGRTASGISARPSRVMRALLTGSGLTATRAAGAKPKWFLGEGGEERVLAPGEKWISSETAAEWGIIQGLASGKSELVGLLGCESWVEVGHEASAAVDAFAEAMRGAEDAIDAMIEKLYGAIDEAKNARTRDESERILTRARQILDEIESLRVAAPTLRDHVPESRLALFRALIRGVELRNQPTDPVAPWPPRD